MTNSAVETAVSKDGLVLPLIDFSLFLKGSEQDKLAVAKAMTDGFKNAGFLYIKNHGIPQETVDKIFSESAKFFARPQEQKDQLRWTTPESNRGYVSYGREKVTKLTDAKEVAALSASEPDMKESIEIGKEGVEGMPNNFPDRFDADGVEFTKTMRQFFLTCKELHNKIMSSLALGMNLPEGFFDSYTDGGDNNLRLLHYPSTKKDEFKTKIRAGLHTDYGSITLLFQDNRGGLQVRSPKGSFVDATPIPGTIVINSGDLLARWSNNTIASTEHQVVEPPQGLDQGSDSYPPRYSVAYFCNPNYEKTIEALPGTFVEGKSPEEGGKRYPAINSGEYLFGRLAATYVGNEAKAAA